MLNFQAYQPPLFEVTTENKLLSEKPKKKKKTSKIEIGNSLNQLDFIDLIDTSIKESHLINEEEWGLEKHLTDPKPSSSEDLFLVKTHPIQLSLRGFGVNNKTILPTEADEKRLVSEERTFSLGVSGLEEVFGYIQQIPYFQRKGDELGDPKLRSFSTISTAIDELNKMIEESEASDRDFMLLEMPQFQVKDMNIFFLNLPEIQGGISREELFNEIYSDWFSIIRSGTRIDESIITYLREHYSQYFIDSDIEDIIYKIYQLIKLIDFTSMTWGGEQVHLYEQLFRDYIYWSLEKENQESLLDRIYYENPRDRPEPDLQDFNITYFEKVYPKAAPHERELYMRLIESSLNAGFDIEFFQQNFELLMNEYRLDPKTPPNTFDENEVKKIWSDNKYIKWRLSRVTKRYKEMYEDESDEEVIDFDNTQSVDRQFATKRATRLSNQFVQGLLPSELIAGPNASNEFAVRSYLLTKLNPNVGPCMYVIVDRVSLGYNGDVNIEDFKSRTIPTDEMSDIELYQIILMREFFSQIDFNLHHPDHTRPAFIREGILATGNSGDTISNTRFNHRPEDFKTSKKFKPELFDKNPEEAEFNMRHGILEHNIPPEEVQRLEREFAKIFDFILNIKVYLKKYLKARKSSFQFPHPKLLDPNIPFYTEFQTSFETHMSQDSEVMRPQPQLLLEF